MGEEMKSSTLRRSNLTREKMAMLSALSDYNVSKGRSNGNITDKQAELDLLWQNFKVAATPENSPKSFFTFGFISGVIVAVIAMTLFNFVFGSTSLGDININPVKSSDNVKFGGEGNNNKGTKKAADGVVTVTLPALSISVFKAVK